MRTINTTKTLGNTKIRTMLDKAIQNAIAGKTRLVGACTKDQIEYAAPQLTAAGLTVQVTPFGIRVSR